jgi:nucleoid-associated protein YgaU
MLGMSVLVTTSALARDRRSSPPPKTGRLVHAPPWSEPGWMPAQSTPAGERPPAFPHRGAHSQVPPWSEPGGYLPPHRPGRAGAEARSVDARDSSDHAKRPQAVAHDPRGHPTVATYVVRPGDSLWSIAGEWLATQDAARIARYWPRIHRANRAEIGQDPNLIRPGQVLAMPSENDSGAGS